MTPRTFWLIIIKIFSLWFGLKFFIFMIQQWNNYISLIKIPTDFFYTPNLETSSYFLFFGILSVNLVLFVFLVLLPLFKTSWLIDKLKLEESFDEEIITLNWNSKSMFSIVIILFSMIIEVRNFTSLLSIIYSHIVSIMIPGESPHLKYLIMQIPIHAISLFLILKHRAIAGYCEKLSLDDTIATKEEL